MEDYKNIQNKDENDLKQRVIITEEELLYLNKQDLIQKWKLQDEYINILEEKSKQTNLEYEKKMKDLEDSKNNLNLEIVKLKNLLLMKYMIREQEQSVKNTYNM